VKFAAITRSVASQRMFITVICFVIDSVRKLIGYILICPQSVTKKKLAYFVKERAWPP